jgi:hypothetical protein
MQRRARSLTVIFAATSLIFATAPAYSATIAGSACAKAGSTKTVSNKKYTCIKSGKKLVWDKSVAVKVAPAIDAKAQAQLGARMANIASVQMLADRIYTNSQGLKVDNPTAKTMKGATVAAQIAAAKTARQMIMSFSPMFPNFDLNDFPKETFNYTDSNMAPAHGVFHLTQDFFASTAGGVDPKQVPSWFSEGSATMFATMVAAKMAKNNPNYAMLAAKNTGDWSKEKCSAQYDNWRNRDTADEVATTTCAAGLGQIMVEALVNKVDALDKVLLVYQMLAIGNSFDEALKYAFGTNKADFFAEMDLLLANLKW